MKKALPIDNQHPAPWRRGVFAPAALLLAAGFSVGCIHDPVAIQNRERTESFDHLTRGQELVADGDFILARDAFLRGIEVSDRPVLQYHVGHTYYRLGQFEQAIPWYDRAIDRAGDYQLAKAERELARVQLARQLEEPVPTEPLGDGEPGLEPLDAEPRPEPAEATETTTTRPSTERLGGIGRAISVMAGRDDSGLAGLPEGVDEEELRRTVFPELFEGPEADLPALRAAARDAVQAGRMDEASRFWERILRLDSADLEARLGLANALHRTGRTRAASEEFQRAQRLYPRRAQVYFEWGNFLVDQDNLDEARVRFRRATELDADHHRAWNNLGVALLRLDNPTDALPCFERATELQPSFSHAWLNKAIAKDELGHPSGEILSNLERYMRLRDTPDPHAERWIRDLRRAGTTTTTTPPEATD